MNWIKTWITIVFFLFGAIVAIVCITPSTDVPAFCREADCKHADVPTLSNSYELINVDTCIVIRQDKTTMTVTQYYELDKQ